MAAAWVDASLRVTTLVVLLVLWHAHPAWADDVRALWVVRTTLTSPAAIDAMVTAARDGGFNTLLVQVRGRGDAYYSGGREPRPVQLAGQPQSFDPLAHTIARARDAGLRVHAWMNVNLVAGVGEIPPAPGHVVAEHPEWLMVPYELAGELSALDARNPEYLRRLVEYVAARPNEVEGLYLSPLIDASAAYTAGVFEDIARRYDVDGIHLDYARYPSEAFDYSRSAMEAFRASLVPELSADQAQRLDTRMEIMPTIYADMFPERFRAFRRSQLTRLVTRIRSAVKTARPTAMFTAAVFPDAADAMDRRFQDWPNWISTGLLDVVAPMAYTTDAEVFETQIRAVRAISGRDRIWGGIGAYRLIEGGLIERINLALSLDLGGLVLFSYDSLAETPAGPLYVSDVGREAFTR